MEKSPRRLIVVRHGERCDFTFSQQGISWMKQAFDTNGRYHQFDLNLPRNLPKRKDGFEMFAYDAPLTEMGYLQSKLTGRALRDHDVKIDHVYCSAALRCVQTAVGIIKGMDSRTLRINVEPGLYEWMHWCRNGVPSWMTPEELSRSGYPINNYYMPLLKPNELCADETLNDFYERSFSLVRKILSVHNEGTVLLVAHGPSMDALTRQLCGGAPRTPEDFIYKLQQIPYLACLQVVEQSIDSDNNGSIKSSSSNSGDTSNKSWKFDGSPIPPLTHASNSSFDTKVLSPDLPYIIDAFSSN
ncbi:Histidine phosphatase (branch 1) family protein [Acanthocheilonema viteae]